MEVIQAASLVVLTFLTRVMPRIGLKYAFSGDTFFHMYMADSIRENKFRLPPRIPNIILNHEYTYPYFYHSVLSLFNKESRYYAERMTGAVCDTLNVMIFYFFSSWAIGYFGIGVPAFTPFLASVVFSLSPGLVSVGGGPRAYRGSPRVFGQTLYFTHIVSYFYFSVTGNIFAVCISVLAVSLMFISAKFSVQALVFFGIFFTIFYSADYSLFIVGGFILSVLLSKGRSYKVLYGQIKHSEFYTKYTRSKGFIRGFKTDAEDLKIYFSRFYRNIRSVSKGKVSDFIKWFFGERYFFHYLIIAYPQIILLAFIFNSFDPGVKMYWFLLLWTSASVFWFLVTSISYIRFFGEAERYLEYSAIASILLGVTYVLQNDLYWVVWCFLGYSVFIYILHFVIFRERFGGKHSTYEEEEVFFGKVRDLERGVILPLGDEWEILDRVRFPLVIYGANIDLKLISLEEFNRLYYNGHMPNKDLEEYVERFKIKYILGSKRNLNDYLENV